MTLRPSRLFRALPLGLAALLALSACDATDPALSSASATADARGAAGAPGSRWAGPDTPPLAEVAVMSQNLYLGGDLFQLLTPGCSPTPTSPYALPLCVDRLYGEIVASDFPARAKGIAAEIARIRPALVGLQEVSTYYVQRPSDFLTGANTLPTEVSIDFLDLLLDALADRGLVYTAVSVSPNSDVELPALGAAGLYDIRYQDADVVLALQDPDVQTGATTAQSFTALLTIPVGGIRQTFVRGYQTVEATVDGYAFTFVNTHFEVGGTAGPIQEAQATELASALQSIDGPVVLVGDLNSPADGSGTRSYGLITGPLADVFARPNLKAELTCCQAADLLNPRSEYGERIDVVLYRGFDRAQKAETVLDEPGDRVLSDGRLLWPSDHAGVAALLVYNLRRARPNA